MAKASYSIEQKNNAIDQHKAGVALSVISKEMGIKAPTIYSWVKKANSGTKPLSKKAVKITRKSIIVKNADDIDAKIAELNNTYFTKLEVLMSLKAKKELTKYING